MKWVYTAMIRPIVAYGSTIWINATNRTATVQALQKIQRAACMLLTAAYPGTPTGAMEMLLNLPPIDLFLLGEATKGAHRISRMGLWTTKRIGKSTKMKSHVDICN
jgi:hypothetical protein